ncbi:alpha-ketoglutarate-dependent dioxygenase AlkB [Streptomyces virginiae]|uniref:alpha-ketoglutarate-dependent dioxygenase AlkB n=1 Tax=Streptomyces virginiae TaxID=1961 RepID=UPI00225467EB|nr:alpha-ketoglutarate-dependent dioxygenase AlkB [Streptomyces virginiae]MCX4958912.1 alpha-ketoglutarate-dependent dioxygenase AlkB [Streptomyces virginiae]MCX5177738.1 alpha-ketoglutarate-dependent dioxygenase AlkB [Streptomyces virginiae]
MPPASRISDEIVSYSFPAEQDLFAELSTSARLEDVGKGRQGAVLTRIDGAQGVPLVRTTTQYSSPAQRFRAVHERLAQQIQENAAISIGFNNALIESYTNAYRTMGGHSDQALDLAEESFIAVFSCYRNPEAGPPRKLMFESKGSAESDTFEIPLNHNSVVAFSVDSNRRFTHKIVLDTSVPTTDNQWLGVTFRTSKTLVRFRDGHAYLPQGARLTSADDEQRREFYRLRRRENDEPDFVYPPLTYTVSESDLLPPL